MAQTNVRYASHIFGAIAPEAKNVTDAIIRITLAMKLLLSRSCRVDRLHLGGIASDMQSEHTSATEALILLKK